MDITIFLQLVEQVPVLHFLCSLHLEAILKSSTFRDQCWFISRDRKLSNAFRARELELH